jgi:cell division inhibitor SulA
MSETALTPQAMGRMGGLARARALSPERRREIALKARLSGAVNTVVKSVPELSEEQKDRLFDALFDLDGDAI